MKETHNFRISAINARRLSRRWTTFRPEIRALPFDAEFDFMLCRYDNTFGDILHSIGRSPRDDRCTSAGRCRTRAAGRSKKKKKSGKKLDFSIVCNIKGKRGKHRRET